VQESPGQSESAVTKICCQSKVVTYSSAMRKAEGAKAYTESIKDDFLNSRNGSEIVEQSSKVKRNRSADLLNLFYYSNVPIVAVRLIVGRT
jgi:hypothetical protein